MHDDLGDRIPGPPVGRGRLTPEPDGQPGQREEADHDHEGELPVEQQHPAPDQDQRQDGRHQRVQALVEQVGDRVDVGHLTRDDPARRVVLVKRHRKPQEVREQPAPQLEDHVGAETAHGADVGAGDGGLNDHGHGERDDDRDERARVVRAGQLRDPVDPHSDQPRPDQGRDVRDHDQQHDHRDPGPVRAQQVLEQAPAPQPQHRGQARRDVLDVLGRYAPPGLGGRLGHRQASVRFLPSPGPRPSPGSRSPLISSR